MHSDAFAARTPAFDIIDSVDVPIIAVGVNCTISGFNPAAAMLLLLTPAEIGRPIREIPVLTNVKRLEELCGEAMSNGASSQCEVRGTMDGSWFVVRIAPYMGSQQRTVGAVLTLQNVTAFRASLEQAIYEREYTKAIINTVTDPLVVLDDDCWVQTANQSFYATFQVSREQAQSVRLYDIGIRDWEIPRFQRFLKETSDNNEFDSLELDHEFPSLGRRTVLLKARRLSQRGNLGKMILLAIQDITERKKVQEEIQISEERLRVLANGLENQVRVRTHQLEQRNTQALLQSEQLRELSNRLLQTQDEERRRIARDLHDSAGQILTALSMNLASVTQLSGRNSKIGKALQESHELVRQLSNEIRTLSYLLHPPLLDENGLPGAIQWYIQGLAGRSNLKIALSIPQDFGRLSDDMEVAIFRIVQECLTNIHRHSESKTATIRLLRERQSVSLEIHDQGKGIPAERLAEIQSHSTGVGIAGIRERVRHLEGTMDIQSDANGTQISVTLPTTVLQNRQIPKASAPQDNASSFVQPM
jgi:signal transduction histidine kinase